MEEQEDTRQDELETLQAIFPELAVSDHDPFTFSLELPVTPLNPVKVTFPAQPGQSEGIRPGERKQAHEPSAKPQPEESRGPELGRATESHELSFLPSLLLTVIIPLGYPTSKPPSVSVETTPSWLPGDVCRKLQDLVVELWEEMGRDQVLFSYIDRVQTDAENVFGIVDKTGTLEVDSGHKIAVLDHDIRARKTEFEKQTYDCGICLDPKRGAVCHKMIDCGHVFCVSCLQDFYGAAITEGDISTIRCLEPSCAKEREKKWADQVKTNGTGSQKKGKKPRTFISPSELLQIPIDTELVKRYVRLKYKIELESDKNTVYCPRQWCQGAARSKKHHKPEGFELAEPSDDEDDGDEANGLEEGNDSNGAKKKDDVEKMRGADLLAVCEDCGFAFCRRCYQSWHGEFFQCISRSDRERLGEEELASMKYIELHTSKCPTCDAPSQKTGGCNHMSCRLCGTHYCYLCSAWLDPQNPYKHFNVEQDGTRTGCFNRLWELENGDGEVGLGYFGGERRRGAARPAPAPRANGAAPGPIPQPEIEEPDSDADDIPANAGNRGAPVEVEREGPLVLRIDGMLARAPPAAPDPPHPPAGMAAGRRGGAPRGRGGRGVGRGGVRGGAANRQRQHQNRRPGQQQGQRRNQPVMEDDDVVDLALLQQEILLDAPGDDDDRNRQAQGAGREELGVEQQAWIREFVRLALEDAEDGI